MLKYPLAKVLYTRCGLEMISTLKSKIEKLLWERNHKEIMFLAILYLGIVFFLLMTMVTFFFNYYGYMLVKFIVFLLLLWILRFYKKTSHLKLSVLFLMIVIDLEISIAILTDEIFLLPTLYPFIAIAGFFFFFNFKEAVILTMIHYLYWIIVFYVGHNVTHAGHPFFSWTYIFNVFATSFFILTFSISYYFSTELTYQEIEKRLKENETILKEIYHRIKNNLNFIASILGLQINQAKKAPKQSYQESLTNTRLLIDTIAITHRVLSETSSFEKIALNQYVESLTSLISKTYAVGLNILIETNNIELGFNATNRLGIMINELLTNTVKYSNPNKIPDISILLKKENDDFHFTYHEIDGKKIDLTKLQNSKMLGMRLIKMIAEEQLEGTLKISWDDGLLVEILFS